VTISLFCQGEKGLKLDKLVKVTPTPGFKTKITTSIITIPVPPEISYLESYGVAIYLVYRTGVLAGKGGEIY
jgi:hypothetical protein